MKNTKIEWNDGYLVARFDGLLVVGDMTRMNDEIVADDRFDKIHYFIIDVSEVTEVYYSNEDFRLHAFYSSATSNWSQKRRIHVGIVVSNSELEQLATKFIELANSIDDTWLRKVFYNFDEAQEWCISKGGL